VADLATIAVDAREDAVVAAIHGDVDLSNIETVRRMLGDALDHAHACHVLDLTQMRFIDSVGIHMLFTIAENMKIRRQQLRIAVPEDSSIARVLRLTDLSSVIPMFPDVATAIAATDDVTF
jgi:anti-anti-sigma factor